MYRHVEACTHICMSKGTGIQVCIQVCIDAYMDIRMDMRMDMRMYMCSDM